MNTAIKPLLLILVVAPALVLATWWILDVAGLPVEQEIGRMALILAPVLGLLAGWFRGYRFGSIVACALGLLLLPLGEAVVFRGAMRLGLSVTTGETLSVLVVLLIAWLLARSSTLGRPDKDSIRDEKVK